MAATSGRKSAADQVLVSNDLGVCMRMTQRSDSDLNRSRRRFVGVANLIAMAAALFVTTASAEPLTLDIRAARVDHDRRTGQVLVSIALMDSSKAAFGYFSRQHVGRPMELRLDGKRIISTVIREPILGGVLEVSGLSEAEAAAIAEQLSTSAGKAQVEILSD